MLKSKPPNRSTIRRGRRLRFLALAAAAALALPVPSPARSGGVKVLVDATVSDAAHETMSPELWAKFVDAYVGAQTQPFAGPGRAAVDDCRHAAADYLVVAPFDLRPRLPGLANASGRVAARTRITVTNCVTGNVVLDQPIDFNSDPPSSASSGDFDSVPEITWGHSIPATLAKYPVPFERVARVTSISGAFALVDLRASARVAVGDALRDFATPDHAGRTPPIVMTVTQVFDRYVQVTFSTVSGDQPSVGDLVETIPKSQQRPAPFSSAPAT